MNKVIKFLYLNLLLPTSPRLRRTGIHGRPMKLLCLSALLVGSASLAMETERDQELLEAAYQGNLRQVEALLNAGVSANTKGGCGFTPLMYAARLGHLEICQLLLDHNAQVDTKDNSGRTPLACATDNICLLFIDAQITKIKSAAIAFLGIKKFRRTACMNIIDKPVAGLIAHQIVQVKIQDLFTQIDRTRSEGLRATLCTYALQKFKMDPKTNNGGSHE